MFINTLQSVLVNNQKNDASLQQANAFNNLITNNPLTQAEIDANKLMTAQRRSPMIFEWVETLTPVNSGAHGASKAKWGRVTLYINPETFDFTQQKVVGKVYTRDGIFYQMWGDDNPTISLKGTTGLSSMEGIKQIENFYYASNTLLAYQPNQVRQLNGNAPVNTGINYQDPQEVMANVTSSTSVSTVQNYGINLMNAYHKLPIADTFARVTNALIGVYANALTQAQLLDEISTATNSAVTWYNNYAANNNYYPTQQQFYQHSLQFFYATLTNVHPSIVVSLASELTSQFYSNTLPIQLITQQPTFNNGINNYVANANNTNSSTLTAYDIAMAQSPAQHTVQGTATVMADNTVLALQTYLQELNTWVQQENAFYKQLKSQLSNLSSVLDFENKWEPRKVIMYFQDRAWIGFFQSFNYTRTAQSPLINYTLQFVVQYQFLANSNAHVKG